MASSNAEANGSQPGLHVGIIWEASGLTGLSTCFKAHPSDADPAVRGENYRIRLLEKRISHYGQWSCGPV